MLSETSLASFASCTVASASTITARVARTTCGGREGEEASTPLATTAKQAAGAFLGNRI